VTPHTTWLVMALCVGVVGGCAGPKNPDANKAPARLTLSLLAIHKDKRSLYFEVDRERQLRFAGGYSAHSRQAKPATKLTAEQLAELWRIIVAGHLLKAKGQFMPEVNSVRYEFSVQVDGWSKSVVCADDRAPALHELEAALHQWYTDWRASQVLMPIERAMEKPPVRRE
jgi:hypothetical protein